MNPIGHPDDIHLENPSKLFEYEKMARQIDECENVTELQLSLKGMIKLFMKQQEVTAFVMKTYDGT